MSEKRYKAAAVLCDAMLTCAAGTDASVGSSIHCVGQHLLYKECIIGDNGCRQVGMHFLCDLQDSIHFAVIILCQDLQNRACCFKTTSSRLQHDLHATKNAASFMIKQA